MRKYFVNTIIIVLIILLAGCGNEQIAVSEEIISKKEVVIGFAQVGAESDWRNTNTESMKSTFTSANGYKLIFVDAQQKQTNQITAIRQFIQQEVDFIVLAPVTEDGWDTVLQEARDAKIPVIIVDRMVNVSDNDLFICRIGSDFELEGLKIVEWLHQYTVTEEISPEDLHIVHIQGNIGASAQLGRTEGLRNAAERYGWEILAELSGDFTQAKGREVMEKFLTDYDNINVVYCENDNEAFGAIEAIEAAGKTVGFDIKNGEIMILSFDGVNEKAMQDVLNKKIACIAECNPLHGPRVNAIIKTILSGNLPEKFMYVDEDIFSAYDAIQSIAVNEKEYNIIILTEEKSEESSDEKE